MSSVLWEFKSPSGQVGYIFGSVHLPLNNSNHIIEQISSYLLKCEVLYTEIELGSTLNTDIEKYFRLQKDFKYTEVLGIKEFQKIKNTLLKYGSFNLEDYAYLKPLITLNQYGIVLCGYDPGKNFLDLEISQFAHLNGITNQGLENHQEHFHYLDLIPLREQFKMLYRVSKNITALRSRMNHILKAYQFQNIDIIYKISSSQLGKWRKYFLHQRNEIMCNKILEMNPLRPVFICVGAAHLAGKYGFLAILKRNHYTVKPIQINILT